MPKADVLTPIQMQVLLHCYYACSTYTDTSQSVYNAHQFLAKVGLIHKPEGLAYWQATKKGTVMVEALCSVPLPTQQWSVPLTP
jgi:hypothetical protein